MEGVGRGERVGRFKSSKVQKVKVQKGREGAGGVERVAEGGRDGGGRGSGGGSGWGGSKVQKVKVQKGRGWGREMCRGIGASGGGHRQTRTDTDR